MAKLNKLTILKEKSSNSITDRLVSRLNERIEKEGLAIQVEVVTFDEEVIQELSGDILLLSLPLMHQLQYLNRLKLRFYFVSFIDPYAYAQLDERRLLKQLQMIEQMDAEKIVKFQPRNGWTYPDYFLALNQMKQEQSAS
ncbi:MAG: hypothetical protein ACLTXM_12485 [Enterococcus sp.]|uniref:hypothetical protein n=1 Tax=Enterococcus TaxID=1350 RepID=UPI0020A20A0E|nr:hypothetical protein [Enterococcus raffinosus]